MTNTDLLTNKVLDLINQVQATITNQGADAVNLLLTSTRVDGIFFMLLPLSLIVIIIFFCNYIKYEGKKEKPNDDDMSIAFAIMAILTLLTFIFLIYPWNWIQIFNPKLYLAHKMLGSFLT